MKYKAKSLSQALYLYGCILHEEKIITNDFVLQHRIVLYKHHIYFVKTLNGKNVKIIDITQEKRKADKERKELKGIYQ